MNHTLLIGAIVSLFGGTLFPAQALRISSSTADASQVLFEMETPSTIDLRPNADFSIEKRFEIPAERPCFLVLETRSNVGGRINLFLEPDPVPSNLLRSLSNQNSAGQEASFQVVIDSEPGGWKRHSLDLSCDFFETLSTTTLPYDPSGSRVKRLRLEVAEPSRPNLQFSVRRLKIVALTEKAMQLDLEDRINDLELLLKRLQPGSTLKKYWNSKLLRLADRSRGSCEHAGDWRTLAQGLDRIHLQSSTWSLSKSPARPYVVGTESSLRRISGNHPRFTFRSTAGARVELQAGRNEYESFQLVILALTEDLRNLRIESDDFVSTDGKRKIARQNLELFHQIEQFVMPSRGTAYDWAGWLPDALLPVTGSFDVPATATKPIWISLYVPEETAAGKYESRIRVVPAGATETEIPVTLEVHDFSIPRTGRFRTQGHFSLEDLQAWYGDRYTSEVRRDYYRLLVKYRQSPTSQYSARLSPEPEDIPWIMREGANVILIGGFSGQELNPEIIGPAYDWLVENNYIDQAIIYVGDETDDFERMKAKSRTIRRNWPKLRIMIGGSKPRRELIGYFDVWDPITHGGDVYNFDRESTRAALERGEEMFWYTCVGPRSPYANVYNDHPLTAIRALWWQAWKYEITGFEYWWFNYWRPNRALSQGDSPWPSSRLREWNSRSFKWSNGDGVLIYPGADGRPLPSIRLSVMRDAIEDWEALFLLKRTVELARQSSLPAATRYLKSANHLLEAPEEITANLTEWSRQPEVYLKARQEVYQLLVDLRTLLGSEKVDRYIEGWIKEHQSWLQTKFEDRVTASQ